MTKDLQDLVKEASAAVEPVKDPDLKKVAFECVLQHLLDGGAPTHLATTEAKPRRAAKRKPAAPRKAATGNGGANDGPKAWLEELIDEGFFDEPRSGADMVKKLGERGHHLVYQDLTKQLKALSKDERRLRRKKVPIKEGAKRQVWHYSKW